MGCTIPDILVNNQICDCPWTCADEAPQQEDYVALADSDFRFQVFRWNCDLVNWLMGMFWQCRKYNFVECVAVILPSCHMLSCFISYDLPLSITHYFLIFSESPYKPPSTSSTRTRRGGSCLRIYYKTFLIYRACMRRAPARPVRACFVRSCCTDVVQEHDLRAAPVQCNSKRRRSSHFTLRSSHPALRTSHLHFALDTSSHLNHVSSSYLISALLISSHLFSHVI